MFLGEILIANSFVSTKQVDAALARQEKHGGALGENLIALGFLTETRLKNALEIPPAEPRDIGDTGLDEHFVLNLILKFMQVKTLETPSEIAAAVKLPAGIVVALMRTAREGSLVHVLGSSGSSLRSELRYELTEQGARRALEQLRRSQYLGPAPVPLNQYIRQIERQHITNEHVSREELAAQLGHLVLPAHLVDELGPAANSAKAMLLYGPPGSGKTSIAEAIGRAFKRLVYVPHAVEVDGEIITIYDPVVHKPAVQNTGIDTIADDQRRALIRDSIDARWVLCRRPTVMTGGELRLEMLDLSYNPDSGVYDAPLQIKAMNGIFIIDDFGRQQVDPRAILNRWIVPLERRFDYLPLNTGCKFLVPFDVLIVFSTNLAPEDLIDEAFLRRIPHKILVGAPLIGEYLEIFKRVCAAEKIRIPRGLVEELLSEFYDKQSKAVASYHPRFLIDRVIDTCRFRGQAPSLDIQLLTAAWRNLFVEKTRKENLFA